MPESFLTFRVFRVQLVCLICIMELEVYSIKVDGSPEDKHSLLRAKVDGGLRDVLVRKIGGDIGIPDVLELRPFEDDADSGVERWESSEFGPGGSFEIVVEVDHLSSCLRLVVQETLDGVVEFVKEG